MVLASTQSTPMWLYDTFSGIPPTDLAPGELYLAGRYSNTSLVGVKALLEEWADRTQFVAGDVLRTIPEHDCGPVTLVHMDLNGAAPTMHALAFAFERMVTGAVLVFDDYGWDGYEEQREAVDAFFADRPESVVALPTGQALVFKLPPAL